MSIRFNTKLITIIISFTATINYYNSLSQLLLLLQLQLQLQLQLLLLLQLLSLL